jgi:hypothetical protein
MSFDSTVASHQLDSVNVGNSVKIDNTSGGHSGSSVKFRNHDGRQYPNPVNSGFAMLRASIMYKSDTLLEFASSSYPNAGIHWMFSGSKIDVERTKTTIPQSSWGGVRTPETGANLPATGGGWVEIFKYLFVPAHVAEFFLELRPVHIKAGNAAFYLHDHLIQYWGNPQVLFKKVTLNGTTAVKVQHGIARIADCAFTYRVEDGVNGEVTVTRDSDQRITVVSDDAGDTGEVTLIIAPPNEFEI